MLVAFESFENSDEDVGIKIWVAEGVCEIKCEDQEWCRLQGMRSE